MLTCVTSLGCLSCEICLACDRGAEDRYAQAVSINLGPDGPCPMFFRYGDLFVRNLIGSLAWRRLE